MNRKSMAVPKNLCGRRSSGFSLLELMIAMAVFVVVGATAMSLFNSHAKLFGNQQNLVGLNISLRNALSQIQTDAVQAGSGFYGALSTANSPVGITVTNNPGANDSIYIIQAATGAVPLNSASGCATTTLGSAVLNASGTGATASQFASGQALFMNGAGNQMTVVKLTGATASGSLINITYNPTNGDGTNSQSSGNDLFGLTWTAPPLTDPDQLSDQFCPTNGDYVVPLSYVQYSVNGTNQLIRTTATNAASPDVIADQILSFKIGAATYQNGSGYTSTPAYSFTASNANTATPPGYSNKFSMIRSIRVSVVGRTPPGLWTGTNFANSFDGGNYQIEALSVVINPRNLSMND
jgi:prepilin-type N-terminal cleavage/methylation domain-containing protein